MKRSLAVFLFSVLCVAAYLNSAAGETNGISPQWLDPSVTWGPETNRVRAGVVVASQEGKTTVVIAVLGSATNAGNYVKSPESRMADIQLRDSQGKLIKKTKKGENATGNLPGTIPSEDLPRVKGSGRPGGLSRDGMLINRLSLTPNYPTILHSFIVEDYFLMQSDLEHTLSVTAALYKFSPDEKRVTRVNLPPVVVQIRK